MQVEQPVQAHVEMFTPVKHYRTMEMTFWLPGAEAALAGVAGSGSLDNRSGS